MPVRKKESGNRQTQKKIVGKLHRVQQTETDRQSKRKTDRYQDRYMETDQLTH